MRILLLVPAISLVLSVAVAAQQQDQDKQTKKKKTESADAAAPNSSEMKIILDELIDELGSPRFTIRLQAARETQSCRRTGH